MSSSVKTLPGHFSEFQGVIYLTPFHLLLNNLRPLKNGNFRSLRLSVRVQGRRSASGGSTTGIHVVFRGLEVESDLSACNAQAGEEIEQKVLFYKCLNIIIIISL